MENFLNRIKKTLFYKVFFYTFVFGIFLILIWAVLAIIGLIPENPLIISSLVSFGFFATCKSI